MASSVELKDFAATKKMRGVMGRYFMELMGPEASDNKIAWCTSVGPAELLRALGFEVYFPENHGAMLGASRMATDLIPQANARGFSPEICSYLTSDIGSYLKGESPFSKMELPGPPKADVLVFNTNQCRDVKDWFSFYAREWDVPCIGIHTPRAIGEVDDIIVEFVARQIESLVQPLEQISGNKLDMDKLREVIVLSAKCTELWKEVLEAASNVPSPITFFDGTIQMGPAVVLRGTQEAIDYYDILLAELKQRIADGVGAVEVERHRIYWEGMPIWGKLKNLALQFMELQTAVVASTYCNSWVFEALDPDKPFEGMARAYSELYICRSDEPKEAYMERMIEKFKVDGVLYHNAKTCPNNSNSRYCLPQRLRAKTGKPFVIIDGDLNDLRLYSEEQTRTNIEAFVEQLSQG
ncbi:MAG: 2-hydroxyacyl-CoA dehydratase subunit D [Planctomycetota bacterium]|jgi:benzoyl-CoA reductase/2-hydroxyglutaryl-CoA dehydratase subunit BcrC/BadD/HgdB